jgi:hypothetical protein
MRKLNETILLSGLKPGSLKLVLTCLVILTGLSLPRAVAGTDMKEITPPSCCCTEKEWTIELGTGVAWSNVPCTDQPHGQFESG